MKKNNVKWFKSKSDLSLNLEKYLKKDNLLFITGLVGSGKSTLAKELGIKYNATVIIQDYLAWSDCYDNEECKFFVNLFQTLYPETKKYFKDNEWRKNNLTSDEKKEYRKKFDKMVIDYAKENGDRYFIYEGSDIFCTTDVTMFDKKPMIIKRTSALLSFVRNYKRGNNKDSKFKEKLAYLKRMSWEFKRFYINDLPRLNEFINKIDSNNNK